MPQEPTPRPPLPIHFLAGLFLLACFAAQCLYVASHAPLTDDERTFASPGPQFAGHEFSKPPDPFHSPLIYHLAQFPVRHGTVPWFDFVGPRYTHRWLLRLPFLIFGILRGASLWFVARRLFGRLPGLFALALYCFSPRMVAEGSHISPDGLAAWGVFGVVYLAIASAHTLYASPGLLTWHDRWRRPILMGVSFGIAVAANFVSFWIALPLAIAFLLYLVPGRRREAAAMLGICGVLAVIVFFAVYRLSSAAVVHDVSDYLRLAPVRLEDYFRLHHEALREAVHGTNYGMFAMTIAGLLCWLIWRRARWFANTAALIALFAVLLLTCAGSAQQILGFWAPATAFLFMFLAGIFADALDTAQRKLAIAVSVALLLVHIAFGLARTLTALSS